MRWKRLLRGPRRRRGGAAEPSPPGEGGQAGVPVVAGRGLGPAEEVLLLLPPESPVQRSGLRPHSEVASSLPAQGVAAGGRNVRTHRWDPPGPPVHRLLPTGQPGPRLRALHLLLRLHHLRLPGHLQTHLCGHLRGPLSAGGAGGGSGVGAGRVPDRSERQQQRRPAGQPGELHRL